MDAAHCQSINSNLTSKKKTFEGKKIFIEVSMSSLFTEEIQAQFVFLKMNGILLKTPEKL